MVAVFVLPSLVWIVRDRTVWPWDQAWYGEVSVDLWYWLGHSSRLWTREMLTGLYMKPPGIVWLGQFFVPLRGLFGSVETALLFSIVLTEFVMLVILLKIGQRMAPQSRLVPLGAVFLASSTQLFVGLSHQFLVEPLQGLAVAWCFYIALRSPDWPKARIAVHLASALVLGALAKATTPLYCLMPCAYCGYIWLRKPSGLDFATEWKSRSSRALVLVFGLTGILCSLWYIRNIRAVWQHVHDASFGDLALGYGTRDSVLNKLIVWSRIFDQSFLDPYLYWVCVAAILLAGGFALYRRARALPEHRLRVQPVAVLSVIQAGLLLFAFSLNITVEPRVLYAMLPCVVILLVQLLVFVPRIALVALLALGAAQWIVVNGASLGLTERLANQSQWLVALQADSSQYDELSRVVNLTSDVGERYNIVGVEYPWLNANSAAFFAAKERLKTGTRSYYTSLGYAEKDVDVAMRRIEELKTRYLITVSEKYQSEPNFVNVVPLPVLERVRRDSRFTQCAFPSERGVVLFRFVSGSQATEPRLIPSPGVETTTACK